MMVNKDNNDVDIHPYFYFYVELPNKLNKILYSDTDSMFILLDDTIDKIDDVVKVDEEIVTPLSMKLNETIRDIWKQKILSRANVIDDEYNKLDFKTEMILDFIIYSDVKKRYVYRILKEKKNVFKEPKVSYKGFEFTRSDASKFIKELQKAIVNLIIDTPDIKELYKRFNKLCMDYLRKLYKAVDEFDIDYFGIPKNWSASSYKKEPSFILGAKFYNTFIVDKIRPGTKGLTIPIEFEKNRFKIFLNRFKQENRDKQYNEFQLNLNDPNIYEFIISKVTFLFLPPGYNKERIIDFFNRAGIQISKKSLKSNSYDNKIEVFKTIIENTLKRKKIRQLF